jgi:hypothetical protein
MGRLRFSVTGRSERYSGQCCQGLLGIESFASVESTRHLTLASPEVKFVLDSESLNPTDVQAYALVEANAVVESLC